MEKCFSGMAGKSCVYPIGKVLGGSCVLGDMVYTRGGRAIFDEWEALGNKGWSYKDVLPYFIKTENMKVKEHDKGYHGYAGELIVDNTYPDPINHEAFIAANEELGTQELDTNGKQQTSISRMPWTIDFNKKLTGGNLFVAPIMDTAKNLKVSLNSFATKILFEGKKAVGVEFIKEGTKYTAKATREVIMSAGAINTPQILMLSGVGPKDELTKLGIEVINDLPVGKNFKDHPVFLPIYIRTNTSAPTETLYDQVKDYLEGKAPLTTVFSASPVAFINTKNSSSPDANVEVIFVNPPQSVPPNTSMFYNLDAKHQEMFAEFNASTDHLVYVINLLPKSVGSVTLKSNSYVDYPIIDPAFYTDENNEDIETVYEGIEYVQNLLKTKPLQALNATIVGVAPECASLKDKEYWLCAIKYLTSTVYRPACTTRMGTSTEDSVVDSSLKIHNMEGIRIADAGVMPKLVTAHPFAAVFMIAEKLADMIKEEYNVTNNL